MDSAQDFPKAPDRVVKALRAGMVIPAHPLALNSNRTLDESHQRALSRYYLDAGAGGLAVGVHTTEFAIHDPKVGLYRPVLELAMETVSTWKPLNALLGPPLMVAGIIGKTSQAVGEAQTARELGYDVGLLGLGALSGYSDEQLVEHARRVARVLPIMGFYLQPDTLRSVLEAAGRNTQPGSHQDGSLQPLLHPGGDTSGGRRGRSRADRPVHG